MPLQDIFSGILVLLILGSVAGSVGYIAYTAGNPDTRNEIQKHVAILTTVNLLTTILFGVLVYMYILRSPASFFPITIVMMFFNMFLSIMAVSISSLQQIS